MMIYYIIPPLIIIIGAAILIYFFLQKASRIPEGELALDESKKTEKLSSRIKGKTTGFLLSFLEKITQKFKLYSLKFHNCSQKWFQSIKKKKEQKNKLREQQNQKTSPQKDIQSPLVASPDVSNDKKEKLILELEARPMISRTVILPDLKKPAKNRLEEALIERIVSNPQDIEAYERLGNYYLEQEEYNESLECFKHVLKLSPLHRKSKLMIRKLEKLLKK